MSQLMRTELFIFFYACKGKLYYRYLSPKENQLSPEIFTTITYPLDKYLGPNRSDPEIKVEFGGEIHVFVGQQYASWNGKEWIRTDLGGTRDTDMAVNSKSDVFINKRGGNHNGTVRNPAENRRSGGLRKRHQPG